MRRVLATAFVLLFALQPATSSASTFSAPNVQPLLAALQSSWIFAAITGQAQRYDAMHAPKPTPVPLTPDAQPSPVVQELRLTPRTLRVGTEHPNPGPFKRWNVSQSAPDPLAMTSSASAQRSRPRASVGSRARAMTAYTSSSTPTTGVNAWWTYEEGAIPGVGKYMANVSNGNLLVQSDDVDIPLRGIDLAFRRTYNSQSQEGQANTDGSGQGVYGEGWTNTFDTRIAYDATNNVISIFDLDGARYDYTSNGSGGWTPPPGMQGNTLVFGGNYYYWTKKNGTQYMFVAPYATTANPAADAGLWGRMNAIFGRNGNNVLVFYYSFANNDASNVNNLTKIVAAHAGDLLTLTFTLVNGHPELATLLRPDSQVITYSYDSAGNLAEVSRPGLATDAVNRTSTTTALSEEYWYYAGTHQMYQVGGPRFVWSYLNGEIDGGYLGFKYTNETTTGMITAVNSFAMVNFTPADGQSASLQPGVLQNIYKWRAKTYTGIGTGTTTYADSQGHGSTWSYDTLGRVTQTQDWSSATQALTSSATWDANNEITSATDARGNVTNYTYDANGNTLSVKLPSVATSMGQLNPTSLFGYDTHNNVIASCDANYVAQTGATTCAAVSGTTHYTYDYSDANEPFGKLTDTYTPLGYHHHITYDSNDYGLPVSVQGDAMTQNDGTQRQPTQTFAYDSYGNLTSYNKGNGAWSLTYDAMNRPLTHTDPDGVTSYSCYNTDGSVAYTETASQHALDGNPSTCQATAPAFAISQTYDADGNVIKAFSQFTRTAANASTVAAGETDKWYDGEDRLVEVKQPYDSTHDAYSFAWMTRYIYDLTNAQGVSISGGPQSYQAYGNLYKTQECLIGPTVTLGQGQPTKISGGCSFQDVRGNEFDALDRAPQKIEVANGAQPEAQSVYDANGNYGLVSQKITGTGQTDTLAYDSAGRLLSETFNDGITANRTFTYDPDGRTISQSSPTFGAKIMSYDADGREIGVQEPASLPNAGTITYGYYADGMRKSLSLAIAALSYNQANQFTYNYRSDGARSSLVAQTNPGGTFAWTYTNAGRMLSESDPLTGPVPGSSPTVTYAPRTFTYDAYGQVASLGLPSGFAMSAYGYDAQGETLGYTASGYSAATGTVTAAVAHAYTTRGELFQSTGLGQGGQYLGSGQVTAPSLYADGVQCPGGQGACIYDTRSGMMTGTAVVTLPVNTHTYAYDLAGRQHTDTTTGNACGATTRAYDTDNHTISQTGPSNQEEVASAPDNCYAPTQTNYVWGPDGHLAMSSAPTLGFTGTSYHWDGDDLLYQVGPASSTPGANAEFFIEKLAHAPGPATVKPMLVVDDRDETGTNVNAHSIGGYGALEPAGQYSLNVSGLNGNGKCLRCVQPWMGGTTSITGYTSGGAPGGLLELRSDGYYDGLNSFQGVRAFDPTTNQWTTPDAYSGDVHDPMSQHPYMWNGNNSMVYSDPTGYDPEDKEDDQEREVDDNVMRMVFAKQEEEQSAKAWTKGNYSSSQTNMERHLDKHEWEFPGMSRAEITEHAQGMFHEAVENVDNNLKVFAGGNGSYKVYDPKSGDFGVFEANGKIDSIQNLKEQGMSNAEISKYLAGQGAAISSVPCTSNQQQGPNQ